MLERIVSICDRIDFFWEQVADYCIKKRWLFFLLIPTVILLSNLLILVNDFLYWDDWVWFYQGNAERIRVAVELGYPWAGYVSNWIYSLPNPTLFLRLVVFLATLFTGVIFSQILRKRGLVSHWEGIGVILLYCLLPVASGIRYVNSCAFYSLYILFFVIGCSLILSNDTLKFYQRLLAYLFFIVSFFFNSLLVLFLGVLLVRALFISKGPKDLFTVQKITSFLRSHIDFIFLPFIFWIVKKIYMEPSGFYQSYNSVSIEKLFAAGFKVMPYAIKTANRFFSFLFPFLGSNAWLSVCIVILLAVALTKFCFKKKTELRSVYIMLGAGCIFIALAIFPYIVVGHKLSFYSFYQSRHLILVLFGLTLVFIALFRVVFRCSQVLAFILFCAVLITGCYRSNVAYIKLLGDGFAQQGLINSIKSECKKKQNYSIALVVNKVHDAFYQQRTLLSYEYTGYFVEALNRKNVFALDYPSYKTLPLRSKMFYSEKYKRRYNFEAANLEAPELLVIFDYRFDKDKNRKLRMSDGWILKKFLPLYLFDKQGFVALLNKMFIVRYYEGEVVFPELQRQLKLTQAALEEYRSKYGTYPTVSKKSYSPVDLAKGCSLQSSPELGLKMLKTLVPVFMSEESFKFLKENEVLYIASKTDYKLLFITPSDYYFVRQKKPQMIDCYERGYGVWSPGAAMW